MARVVLAASSRCGSAACATYSRPWRLSAIIRSHSSVGASTIGPSSMTPALLTTRVQAAELVDGPRDERLRLLLVGDVALDRERAAAGLLDLARPARRGGPCAARRSRPPRPAPRARAPSPRRCRSRRRSPAPPCPAVRQPSQPPFPCRDAFAIGMPVDTLVGSCPTCSTSNRRSCCWRSLPPSTSATCRWRAAGWRRSGTPTSRRRASSSSTSATSRRSTRRPTSSSAWPRARAAGRSRATRSRSTRRRRARRAPRRAGGRTRRPSASARTRPTAGPTTRSAARCPTTRSCTATRAA